MITGITPAQSALLEYLRAFSEREGHAPSYEQMMAAIGYRSKSNIHRLITCLHERGLIRRMPGRSRAIEIIDQSNLPRELEQRIAAHCRKQGISRASFDVLSAEQYLRSVP